MRYSKQEVDEAFEALMAERRTQFSAGGWSEMAVRIVDFSFNGDKEATAWVAQQIYSKALFDKPMSPAERTWLLRMMHGVFSNPKTADSLTRAPGKTGHASAKFKRMKLAWCVFEEVRYRGARSTEEAWEQVADHMNVSSSSVKQAWMEFRPKIEAMMDKVAVREVNVSELLDQPVGNRRVKKGQSFLTGTKAR